MYIRGMVLGIGANSYDQGPAVDRRRENRWDSQEHDALMKYVGDNYRERTCARWAEEHDMECMGTEAALCSSELKEHISGHTIVRRRDVPRDSGTARSKRSSLKSERCR